MRSRFFIFLLFLWSAAFASADPWQQRWSEHLSHDVLPHWLAENPAPSQHFMPQLRQLYVTSVGLARATDPAAQSALRARLSQQLATLVARFQDPATGDWHALAREVRPAAKTFSTQDQIWAVYLLADIHTRTGDPTAHALAQKTFVRLDRFAHDELHGGYYLDYTPSAPDAPRDHEASRKNSAVQLHTLLALARLRAASPADDTLRLRFDEIRAALPRFIDPASGHARWALARDWRPAAFKTPADNQTLYGQNAEFITYLLDVATVSGEPFARQRPLLEALARGLLRDGLTADGAVCFRGPMTGPATDRRVWWWTQAETAAALWQLHALTRDPVYLDAFHRVSAWTFTHTIPPQAPALWRTLTDADGNPLPHGTASHELQTGFHAIRSILLIKENAP